MRTSPVPRREAAARHPGPPAPPHDGGVPLRRLVDTLGADLTELVIEIPEDSAPVCDVVLHDAQGDDGIEPGDLVLAAGVGAGERELLEVLDRAAAARAAAVAVKRRLLTGAALRMAAERGAVAVVAVPDEANWAHVVRLVRNVLASSANGAGGAGGANGSGGGLSSGPGDLFMLADGLASMVGGNVLIEDPSLRVLAYSRSDQDVDRARRLAILQRRCPEEFLAVFRREGVLDAIRSSDEVVRVEAVPDIGLGARLVCGVRVDNELLGSLWVTFPSGPADPAVEAQLSAASRISALHLARHRAHELGIDIQRDRALRDLLEGRATVDSVADTLGLERAKGAAVLCCVPLGTAGDRGAQALRDVLTKRCLAHRWQVLTSCHGARLDAVFGGLDPGPSTEKHLARLARSVAADAEKRRLRCVIAVGSVVPAGEIESSFAQARSVLGALRRAPHKGPVARAGDVWAHLTLEAVLRRAADDLAAHDAALRELTEHDRRHHTDYVHTLRTYLDTMGDSTSAAHRLGIHPNTLRYRLRRLAEFTDIDLGDPVERLVMALQLHRLVPADKSDDPSSRHSTTNGDKPAT